MSIGWHSQPFPPSGASTAEGIRNQLGRPALNMLTVLVREAAQNSSDAALDGHQVRFSIDLDEFATTVAPRWRETLLPGAPSNDRLPLRKSLQGRTRILSVSDRGTRGLGGPTRADNAVTTDNDFVAFVRNVGEPRNVDFGGGTYGFGKGIFFLLSRCGTVLIHTRCRVGGGKLQTRLIGCSLWYSYTKGEGESGRRFTGRHWWGDTSGEVLEPLVDDEADRMAEALRLPGFTDDETGTTVSIIDPIVDFDGHDNDDVNADDAARWMADAIAWNLWPKMITHAHRLESSMAFAVRRNGTEVPIPDPARTSPLHMFVSAYRSLKEGEATEIRALRPKKLLGLSRIDKRFSQHFEPSALAEENGFGRTCNHICLMRSPELVVKYHRGPQTGSGSVGYAGVFRADDEVDDVFARAEPPTHDDWVPANLEGHDRTFVRVAFSRLKEQAASFIETVAAATDTAAATVPLGDVSRRFADLVAGASATRLPPGGSDGRDSSTRGTSDDDGSPQKRPRHRAASSRPRVSYSGEPYFGLHAGRQVIIQKFRVSCSSAALVGAKLAVTLPGASEKDAPTGAAVPTIVGWAREDGSGFTPDLELEHPRDDTPWLLFISPAPDAGTSITITANRMED